MAFFSKKIILSYIEAIVATVIYIAIGLYFNLSDPLFIDTTVPFLSLLLIILTLFHGLRGGLISLVLVSFVLYRYYFDEGLTLFLSHLLLILILDQFYYYWNRELKKAKAEFDYTNQRLEELSNAFYTLKISHDILEKSYTLKPHSLRSSMSILEELYFKNDSYYKNFLLLLAKSFHVEGSLLALLENESFRTVASFKDKKELDLNDALVESAINTKETSYVGDEDIDNNSLYLAVIPIKNRDNTITDILAIDKLPFTEFNQDNIISIAILFSYFTDQVKIWDQLKKRGEESVSQHALFLHTYESVEKLQETYNSNSSVIIIKIKDSLILERMVNTLNMHLRGLDKYEIHEQNGTHVITLLLPITPKESCTEIINTILMKAKVDEHSIDFMYFNILQKALIQRYISEESK